MATERQMNELLGRMITDNEFRDRLVKDPKTAVEEAGFELTPEQLAQLEAPEMGELVGAVDEHVSKFLIATPGMIDAKTMASNASIGISGREIM